MMGNKKLSTIRKELKGAMEREGKDPIDWLETAIVRGERKKQNVDVLESIKSVLEGEPRKTPKKRGTRTRRA
jgi:hypothetical protein